MVESQDFTMFGSDESDLQDKENEFYKKVSELIKKDVFEAEKKQALIDVKKIHGDKYTYE